jgi:hypothetical protein
LLDQRHINHKFIETEEWRVWRNWRNYLADFVPAAVSLESTPVLNRLMLS